MIANDYTYAEVFAIRVPSTRTNSIQEMHIVIGHMLRGFVEEEQC